jgi:hypothetical protein
MQVRLVNLLGRIQLDVQRLTNENGRPSSYPLLINGIPNTDSAFGVSIATLSNFCSWVAVRKLESDRLVAGH